MVQTQIAQFTLTSDEIRQILASRGNADLKDYELTDTVSLQDTMSGRITKVTFTLTGPTYNV